MRHLCRLAILLAALAAGATAARAQDAAMAEFVANIDSSLRTIHGRAAGNEPAVRSQCRSLTARVMEVDTMARAAIGDIWEQMNAAQRTAYRAAFETRLSRECVRSVGSYRGERLTLAGVRAGTGGERYAISRYALDKDPGRMVTWRVRSGGSTWRAIDVIIEGRSTVITARDEIASVLRSNQGNIDALITFMQR